MGFNEQTLARLATWQHVLADIALIIPNLIGAVASFFYFIRKKNNRVCPCMIYAASILALFRIIYSNYQMNLAMITTINLVLKLAIYGLIVYQTHTLEIKRKNAIEVKGEEKIASGF